jgi:hypothetical protein
MTPYLGHLGIQYIKKKMHPTHAKQNSKRRGSATAISKLALSVHYLTTIFWEEIAENGLDSSSSIIYCTTWKASMVNRVSSEKRG